MGWSEPADIKELIKIWHDSVVEFGRELGEFINGLPLKRARFWGIDLWLFLQDQRDRGMKVDEASYQRLRTMLEEVRDEIVGTAGDCLAPVERTDSILHRDLGLVHAALRRADAAETARQLYLLFTKGTSR